MRGFIDAPGSWPLVGRRLVVFRAQSVSCCALPGAATRHRFFVDIAAVGIDGAIGCRRWECLPASWLRCAVGGQMARRRRGWLVGARAGVAAVVALTVLAACWWDSPKPGPPLVLDEEASYPFDGWGTSLAWWANIIGSPGPVGRSV